MDLLLSLRTTHILSMLLASLRIVFASRCAWFVSGKAGVVLVTLGMAPLLLEVLLAVMRTVPLALVLVETV